MRFVLCHVFYKRFLLASNGWSKKPLFIHQIFNLVVISTHTSSITEFIREEQCSLRVNTGVSLCGINLEKTRSSQNYRIIIMILKH